MSEIGPAARRAVLLRSFLIQGSWNYRTMIGNGMAFALRPVLRRLGDADADRLSRHASHFNAHPYLSAAALGALARMEADGADPATVTRFRDAVRGPLGAIGDRLVWAGWLPLCSLVGVAVFWAAGNAVAAVLTFLLLYNAGHVALRIWGFHQGWNAGPRLGSRLREAGLGKVSGRLERLLPVAIGLVVGVGLGSADGVAAGPAPALLGLCGVLVGLLGGSRVWKPAAATAVIGVVILLAWTVSR